MGAKFPVDVGDNVTFYLPYKLPDDVELISKAPTTEHAQSWYDLGKAQFEIEHHAQTLPSKVGVMHRMDAIVHRYQKRGQRGSKLFMPRGLTLLFVGPSGCGKDEVGKWFRANTTLNWAQSLSAYGLPYFADALAEPRNYVYDHRHKLRTAFRFFMDGFRHYIPDLFVRFALNDGDVITGIRSLPELIAAHVDELIDLVIWIERPGIPKDPTLEIRAEQCSFTILNEGPIEHLHVRLADLAESFDVLKK